MGAVIGVVDRLTGDWPASPAGHVQSVDDWLGVEVIGDGVPDYLPVPGVDDHGHVDAVFVGGVFGVGPGRSALPVFRSVVFSGPPSGPDVRLSPHPALHVVRPLVRVILSLLRSTMGSGSWRPGSGSARC